MFFFLLLAGFCKINKCDRLCPVTTCLVQTLSMGCFPDGHMECILQICETYSHLAISLILPWTTCLNQNDQLFLWLYHQVIISTFTQEISSLGTRLMGPAHSLFALGDKSATPSHWDRSPHALARVRSFITINPMWGFYIWLTDECDWSWFKVTWHTFHCFDLIVPLQLDMLTKRIIYEWRFCPFIDYFLPQFFWFTHLGAVKLLFSVGESASVIGES